jgi:glycerol-3-phosphate cytidylyltransferase-like family protein
MDRRLLCFSLFLSFEMVRSMRPIDDVLRVAVATISDFIKVHDINVSIMIFDQETPAIRENYSAQSIGG